MKVSCKFAHFLHLHSYFIINYCLSSYKSIVLESMFINTQNCNYALYITYTNVSALDIKILLPLSLELNGGK